MDKFYINICIITYQRSELLKRTLLSLLEPNQLAMHNARIIVIDNDVQQSARPTVEVVKKKYPDWIDYYIEKEKGYASARNKCIEVCDTDILIFVDDDEWVTEDWLGSLLKTQKEYDAAIVIGPVLPSLPKSTPAWIKQGGFFGVEKHHTGEVLKYGWSGNVLINKDKVPEKELRFDLRYSKSGGEDHELFTRLYRRGCLMVWANEAVVYEEIMAEKLRLAWLIRRAFRVGKTYSEVHLSGKGVLEKITWHSKKLVYFLVCTLLIPVWFLKGNGHGLRMLTRSVSNFGGMSAMGSRFRAI